MTPASPAPTGRGRGILLWVLATVLMLCAAVYQRLTGPTYPLRVRYEVAGESYGGRLLRSHVTDEDAPIAIPTPAGAVVAQLHYKRLGTEDPLTAVPMVAGTGEFADALVGHLPAQPPAGKLEYHITLDAGGRSIRLPEGEDDEVVIRFKGHVPLWVLLPHVAAMFFAVLIGMRTAFAGMFVPAEVPRLTVITLSGLTLGGMILGPIVQKHAFGEYWTGWPNGMDLTDNKTLIMWGAWVIAFLLMLRWQRTRPGRVRVAVVLASLVMLVVYLVPHSLRGSTLDYGKLDQGVDPARAIKTG